jgi:protein SCO1/2
MFTRSLLRSSAAIPRRMAQPARRHYASQGFRDKSAIGPFTWKAASLFVLTGAGLYVYFESEKSKIQERKRTSCPGLCCVRADLVQARNP